MNIKNTARAVTPLFRELAANTLASIYDKEKARFVAPLPDGLGTQLVAEGTSRKKGSWQVYLQTPIPGGGRILQDLFEAPNKTVIGRMDSYIDDRTGGHNSQVDDAYIIGVRLPLKQVLDRKIA